MRFLDLFAGIGGFRLGMEAAGHECVGFCEIDKFARESYKAIHDTKGEIELHDITAVSDDTVRGIGRVDVMEDFRARLSALRENGKDLKILEELCFLKSHASHLFSDLVCYSLRTSKDSSTMMGGIRSRPSSQPWMNWGMTLNGKCLTAKTLESPKIGNVCSLSDILEEQVPEEFFLSAEKVSQLIANQS